MNLGTSLARTSLLSSQNHLSLRLIHFPPSLPSCLQLNLHRIRWRNRHTSLSESLAIETLDSPSETLILEDLRKDTVEQLLSSKDHDNLSRLMKMERKSGVITTASTHGRWFPYLDRFRAGGFDLNSSQVVEALVPHLLEPRREKFRNVVKNRSYGVCLVVEGLTDLGNVSAAFRSADALGFQSVHVISCGSKRLWIRTQFEVSIYDMDWSQPTAIVVGNENRGISEEALGLSDLHCSIPMNGMVDSFNVSVAAGILMHHAVCDRTSRLGCHGDLTSEESQILLAEFFLRHSSSSISIACEYAKRKLSKL